ncbi:MAG: hypothetical protein EP335_18735 [Alphaproteobacteria bacterium]|nr:MAG: hypothetical protein EP335_18735 [Alphaproteobacteria bacterium]
MSRAFLRSAVGLAPLPPRGADLVAFIAWGRRHHILGQLATVWEQESAGKLADVLANARIFAGHDRRMLSYEMNRIARALMGTDIRPVLLKGGAYVAKALTAGEGRRVSDIDILVPEADLKAVEAALLAAGWKPEVSTAGAYDQHYYRDWMHELPPLRHARRRTLIDVHHRLTPRTACLQVDHGAMLSAARPAGDGSLQVFGPMDRFIHSAVHIFADGTFDTPARSLIELYYLFADLDDADQVSLRDRAREVGALWPVDHALWAVATLFGSRRAAALRGKNRLSRLRALPVRLAVAGKLREGAWARLADVLLYPRSHWLRMPVGMLVKHLLQKSRRMISPKSAVAGLPGRE